MFQFLGSINKRQKLKWTSVLTSNQQTMNMKVFVVLTMVIVAVATEGPAYSKPEYTNSAYTQKYDYAPMPYNFAWAVKDDPSYNDFTHQESSDGKVVSGSYKVLLPDGRVQVVTYKVDDYGYVADVQYQGEAKYDYKASSYQAPAAYSKPSYSTPAYTTPAYTAPKYSTPAYPGYSSPSYPATSHKAPAAYPIPSYPNKEAYPRPEANTPAPYKSTEYYPY